MPILSAKVSIKGTRILTQHRFSVAALSGGDKERTGSAGNDPTEWKRSRMVDEEGALYLLPSYIFGSIREGGRYVKKGRSSYLYTVPAVLQVEDDRIYLTKDGQRLIQPEEPQVIEFGTVATAALPPVYVEVCGVKNPSTKARNVRYRLAAKPGWEATFTILWESSEISRDSMAAILSKAGLMEGVGDGRRAGYGRFEVVSFEVSG
jgi:hypothetical protein